MRTNNQWQVFKRLLSYLKPYKWLTLFALALLLLTTVIKSIIPLIASRFIDHYLTALNQPAFLLLLGYYGMYLIQSVVQYLGNLFLRVCHIVLSEISDGMPLLKCRY